MSLKDQKNDNSFIHMQAIFQTQGSIYLQRNKRKIKIKKEVTN